MCSKDIPGKLTNRYGWNEEVILVITRLALFYQLVQFGDDPLVCISQVCRLDYRKTGQKSGYIPKLGKKLFRRFNLLLRAPKVNSVVNLAGTPKPEGISARLFNDWQGIQSVSLTLCPLHSFLIQAISHNPCLGPWLLASEIFTSQKSIVQPGSYNVLCLRSYCGRVSSFEKLLILFEFCNE